MKRKEVRLIDGTREMTDEEILELLIKAEYCTISTIGEDPGPKRNSQKV